MYLGVDVGPVKPADVEPSYFKCVPVLGALNQKVGVELIDYGKEILFANDL